MAIGLVGRKAGMTRVFTEDGAAIPVTVIEVLPNKVTQVKTLDHDGYWAVQVTTGTKKRSHISAAQAGHYAKAGIEPGCGLWEFRLHDEKGLNDITVGSELGLERFSVGQYVDVSGITKKRSRPSSEPTVMS